MISSDVTHFQQFFMLDTNSVVTRCLWSPVLSNSFKCQTCLLRRDTPTGVTPIFPANECADEHFANNHILICLICQSRNF